MQNLKNISQAKKKLLRILYWLPRTLAVLFILFLGIFALDVFIPGRPILEIIAAFLIHLIPNYLLIMALILAWKKELYGGSLFILIGIFFTIFFQTYRFFPNFMIVSFPIFLIGFLFFGHFYLTKKGGK